VPSEVVDEGDPVAVGRPGDLIDVRLSVARQDRFPAPRVDIDGDPVGPAIAATDTGVDRAVPMVRDRLPDEDGLGGAFAPERDQEEREPPERDRRGDQAGQDPLPAGRL
jgi:hypothetical protein